ncbi:ATPase [Desulfonatronospira thiodismutans ASO3-1]|uniref:ATPase n=1 Tax=Desulfonatronospira thiodismutans ASO3-1 TaxID=555779 RepID=D6ST14_9BACT|nr:MULTISPECIES: ATP-binding protein [Desulfonatronospira]EFI33830.1 ATPase [Desulfonatronospira thiodismutans ASO3-1]RQD78629.1 MAG: ATP-binding protein [Desulfonatronospira sp. MSAO_Bac3]
MIKRETYINRVRPFINKDMVKVFTGIRRSGKSTLLKLVQQELIADGVSENQIIMINFESMAYANRDFMSIYQELRHLSGNHGEKAYIFLDEIQELAGWEKMVNSLRVDLYCDLYITGSNSKLLSGELATYLAGRYIEVAVYPFSFQEIMKIKKEKQTELPVEEAFNLYLRFGGMPFLYENNLDATAALDYLKDIYNSIMLKDIIGRHAIRDVELFERILSYLLANVANPFSGSNIMKYLKNEKRAISLETLYNYISYSQEACLLYLTPRENVQGKRILKFQEKIFLADHGLREAIYGNNQRDINQILENIVFLELLRRGYTVRIGKSDAKEINFIAEKMSQRIYIQVAYLIPDQNVAEREFSALLGIKDNYPKMVLSLDKFDLSRKGIVHKNLINFLLEQDWRINTY